MPKKLGLVIGLNSYRQASGLQGAVNDALDFGGELIARGFSTPKYLFDNAATRSTIVTNIGELVGQLAQGDVAVFYFAGHGTQIKTGGVTPSAEALCPWDFDEIDPASTIADAEFLQLVVDAAKRRASLWVVLDSCFSGGFVEPLPPPLPSAGATHLLPRLPRVSLGNIRFAPSRVRGDKQAIDFPGRSAFINLDAPSGVEIFTACKLDEKAVEAQLDDDEMRGVFTNFLVNRSAADRTASATSLRAGVEADIEANGHDQTPQLSSARERIFLE